MVKPLRLLLLIGAFAFIQEGLAQNKIDYIRIDSVDKRYNEAINYLFTNNKELRTKWAEGFSTNKKARREFLNYYDSIRFHVSDTICPKEITLSTKAIGSDIKIPILDTYSDKNRYSVAKNEFFIVDSLSELSPFQKKDFTVGFSKLHQNNLLALVFDGNCRYSNDPCCPRKYGRGLQMLFIFNEEGKVIKVYYSEYLIHFN